MDLAGKVVLVTGASSGIGRATALAFARRGCRVSAAARSGDKLKALDAELRAAGGEPHHTVCDVRDRWQAREAVEAPVRHWGRIDIVVNNAGVLEIKPFERQELDAVEDIMRVNFMGCVQVLHAALPHMRKQGSGHVVNVASVAGVMGVPLMAAYSASKFALVGWTEALRLELYSSGITLTAFCPGSVDTPMVADLLRDPRMPPLRLAKTAEAVAERIVEAARKRSPEVIYGEMPGWLLRLAKLSPRLLDWTTWQILRRFHPLVAEWESGGGKA